MANSVPVNWRTYGGVFNLESFNNINCHILTCDQLTIRGFYNGLFEVNGAINITDTLTLYGNAFFRSNLDVSNNVDISNNLVVGNTANIFQNLYFGNSLATPISQLVYLYGSGYNLGINTQYPKATLDISGANIISLNVYSGNITNTNVIARNVNNKGISVSQDISNSYINFFDSSNIDISSNAFANATIRSNVNGNIDISSNIINIYATCDTDIYSKKNTNIYSGINTSISSVLSVSNRGVSTHLLKENTVIYDISNGIYLIDAYEKGEKGDLPLFKTGNALTLVSDNNFSNTFFNIITPSGSLMGMGMGGGTFPNDVTRSMSTLGVYNASGLYIPTVERNFTKLFP